MKRVARLTAILTAILIAAIAGFVLASAAWAEGDEGLTVDQEVLDVLRENDLITEEKYREMSDKLAEKQKAEAAAAATATAEPPEVATNPEGWTAYWKNNLKIERNDGSIKIGVGGRVQFDAGIVAPNDKLNRAYGTRGTGTDFRRVRLFMSGKAWGHLDWKAEFDFAGQDVDFKDVFIGLHDLPVVGNVRAGHYFEFFSLEQQTSSKYVTFMERPSVIDAFSPGRNAGVGIFDTAFDKKLSWGLGGFQETNDSGEFFSPQGGYNLAMRVSGTPIYEDGGRKLVHLGFAYNHKFRRGDPIGFSAKPESNLSAALVNTGPILTDGVDLFGFEAAAVCGPLAVKGEWLLNMAHRSMDAYTPANILFPFPSTKPGDPLAFHGGYVEVSYFLTGENLAYKQKGGHFDRVTPNESFSIKNGTLGAFQVAARYSYLSLNDADVRGGIQNNFAVGLNWHLFSNLRLMFNVVHAHVTEVPVAATPIFMIPIGPFRSESGQWMYQTRVSLDF